MITAHDSKFWGGNWKYSKLMRNFVKPRDIYIYIYIKQTYTNNSLTKLPNNWFKNWILCENGWWEFFQKCWPDYILVLICDSVDPKIQYGENYIYIYMHARVCARARTRTCIVVTGRISYAWHWRQKRFGFFLSSKVRAHLQGEFPHLWHFLIKGWYRPSYW